MEFGVNLNNREPLITSDYTLADLLDLAELVEQRGFGRHTVVNPGPEDLVMVFSFPSPDYPPTERPEPR
jgi:hypothetical protein